MSYCNLKDARQKTVRGEKHMAIRTEELTKRLMDMAIDGIGLYIGKKASDYVKPYLVKTTKQFSDGAFKIGVSMLDLVFPKVKEIPYLGDWLAIWGRRGVEDVLVALIDKPAFCYAQDANTIVCLNLDTTEPTILIDGAKLKDTDYTVSGTAEELTINLKTALTSGAHDLVVAGLRVSFAGKIYV
jgi:hypothetical protein